MCLWWFQDKLSQTYFEKRWGRNSGLSESYFGMQEVIILKGYSRRLPEVVFIGGVPCIYIPCLFFFLLFSCAKSFSRVRRSATPWTVAHQAPLSMGFSRQEYWSGLPFPSLWRGEWILLSNLWQVLLQLYRSISSFYPFIHLFSKHLLNVYQTLF